MKSKHGKKRRYMSAEVADIYNTKINVLAVIDGGISIVAIAKSPYFQKRG
jgi:hypothetical protein